MITYVNTVLVGKGKGLFSGDLNSLKYSTREIFNREIKDVKNQIIVEDVDDAKFRVGMITDKCIESYIKKEHVYRPLVKWSNAIKKADIKSFNVTNYNPSAQKEDTIVIDFADSSIASSLIGDNATEKRIVLRLTFKDLPTRFRKWTESYEVVVKPTTNAADAAQAIALAIKEEIIKNYKRARIDVELGNATYDEDTKEFESFVTANNGKAIRLTALPYDDDEVVDSISPANKVRFSANVWYTNPQAAGFASKNKYAAGCKILKTPGIAQVGEWKLVRDAESQAMGYQGILNRGECTWPIIKPDMNVEMNATYDSLTLEFENMYRTADDLHRKTKQTLQIFEKADAGMSDIAAEILSVAGIAANELPEIKIEADVQPEINA